MVDDDVALLRVVREAFTASLRCEVDTSPRPEYGFELALKKRYDLFIFDFQMPMIDGAMLFLVSGQANEERAQELLKEPGVRGLVAKPFSINRLLEKARQCVPGLEVTGQS